MLAFPFALRPNGRVAQVEDDSDESAAQQIALLLLTRVGERPMVPEYGVPDPTFDSTGTSDADLAAIVAAFGPQVSVLTVDETPAATDGLSTVEITFTR